MVSALVDGLALMLCVVLTEGVAGADDAAGDSVSDEHTLGDAAAEDAMPVALVQALSDALSDADTEGLSLKDCEADEVAGPVVTIALDEPDDDELKEAKKEGDALGDTLGENDVLLELLTLPLAEALTDKLLSADGDPAGVPDRHNDALLVKDAWDGLPVREAGFTLTVTRCVPSIEFSGDADTGDREPVTDARPDATVAECDTD